MLNPWHLCGPRCYWWSGDLCHVDPVVVSADPGDRGCSSWVCSGCGLSWPEEDEVGTIDHEPCWLKTNKPKLEVCGGPAGDLRKTRKERK